MANKVYTSEEIELQDYERPITIKPLTMKKWKILAKILNKVSEPPEGEEVTFIGVMTEAVAYCMQTYEPELSDVEVLEEYIDIPTMEYILDKAAGVKLTDPNLQAAMLTPQT